MLLTIPEKTQTQNADSISISPDKAKQDLHMTTNSPPSADQPAFGIVENPAAHQDRPAIDRVTLLRIDEASETQRIDNYLAKVLKGVPKSHVYRILRSGEVRVNKKRITAEYRLQLGDEVRVPPIRIAEAAPKPGLPAMKSRLAEMVIYEDDAMLALNKPAGMAVHGGSGISLGVIEQLRLERPQAKFLELVHRLDRETSGVLMVAKKRSALTALHEAMRQHKMDKRYLMMVHGQWQDARKKVTLDLQKYVTESGERRVQVVGAPLLNTESGGRKSLKAGGVVAKQQAAKGKYEVETQISETWFYLQESLGPYSLLQAKLITGRTHQLRVQLSHLGFPILGDDKYGDFALNKALSKQKLKRMYLHSSETRIAHPLTGESLHLVAPLPADLENFLQQQRQINA
jgi:23S rRNA pseudouridine955/2504/2580 synthase